MLALSLRAHRRQPSALRHVAKIAARVSYLHQAASQLQPADELRGEIFVDGLPELFPAGLELAAPPETLEIPSDGTPATLEAVEALSLAEQIAEIDRRHFLRCNLDADHAERAALRAQIETWRAEELDAYQCGQSCDWGAEIEAAKVRIAVLDDNLFFEDVFADEEATPAPIPTPEFTPYERAGIAVAASEAARLALPFWRHYDAQLAETRAYERDCRRHSRREGQTERRQARYQREVLCTTSQVQFIERLAGGQKEALSLVDCDLHTLKMAEASALIQWLQAGRPD